MGNSQNRHLYWMEMERGIKFVPVIRDASVAKISHEGNLEWD